MSDFPDTPFGRLSAWAQHRPETTGMRELYIVSVQGMADVAALLAEVEAARADRVGDWRKLVL